MEAIAIGIMVLMMGFMLFGGHRMMGGHEHEGDAKAQAPSAITNRADQGASETSPDASRNPSVDEGAAGGHGGH